MKKYYILLTLIIFLCNASLLLSQSMLIPPQTFFYRNEKINGGYNGCIAYRYTYKFGEIDSKSKKIISSEVYNNEGYRTELIDFDSVGSITQKQGYKYISSGLISEVVLYDATGSIFLKLIYTYNKNWKIIEDIEYRTWDQPARGKYKYDHGNLIEGEVHTRGYLVSKFINKYDTNNNLIECVGHEINSSFTDTTDNKETFKYDKNNKKIEYICYGSDGLRKSNRIYKYDIKGNLIEENEYTSDGRLDNRDTYRYDNNNNLIEEISFTELNEPEYRIEYIYSK